MPDNTLPDKDSTPKGSMHGPHFLFLDLETTGLEVGVDQITEAAWIIEDPHKGWIERSYLVHHDRLPSEWVLKHTDYLSRIALADKWSLEDVLKTLQADVNWLKSFGATVYMVGACPAFDDRFLRHEYGEANVPYHYHVLDIEAMALGRFPYSEPPSLKHLRALLGIDGENEAAHTALADAREVKLIFDALKNPVAA